jgi:predicted  nucleic acid-binding Zn-ribbon protein
VDLNKQISDLTEDIDDLKEDKRINREYINHLKKEIVDLRGRLEEERKENAGLKTQIQEESKHGKEALKEMGELELKVKVCLPLQPIPKRALSRPTDSGESSRQQYPGTRWQ